MLTASHIITAIVMAGAYAAWPLVGKSVGVSGAWLSTMVLVGSVCGGLGLSFAELRNQSLPAASALAIMFVMGLMNGAALRVQSTMMANPAVPAMSFIVTLIVLMILFTALLDAILNGGSISLKQAAGLVTAIITVFLLVG